MNAYDKLFAEYVEEMSESRLAALDWWERVIAREAAALGSRAAAEDAVSTRWPFGAASHPFVLATFRKYYLLCERLNEAEMARRDVPGATPPPGEEQWGDTAEAAPEVGPVTGWALLIDGLWGQDEELAQFLEAMVFKPIGTDPDTERFV